MKLIIYNDNFFIAPAGIKDKKKEQEENSRARNYIVGVCKCRSGVQKFVPYSKEFWG